MTVLGWDQGTALFLHRLTRIDAARRAIACHQAERVQLVEERLTQMHASTPLADVTILRVYGTEVWRGWYTLGADGELRWHETTSAPWLGDALRGGQ